MKVIMGTALGVDIYVKPDDYKVAKEILENTSLEGEYLDYQAVTMIKSGINT